MFGDFLESIFSLSTLVNYLGDLFVVEWATLDVTFELTSLLPNNQLLFNRIIL